MEKDGRTNGANRRERVSEKRESRERVCMYVCTYVRGPCERRREEERERERGGQGRARARARKKQRSSTAANTQPQRGTTRGTHGQIELEPRRVVARAHKLSQRLSQSVCAPLRPWSVLLRAFRVVDVVLHVVVVVLVLVVVVVVSWPRRVRLTNLVPPNLHRFHLIPLLVSLFHRFCRALSRSATLLSRSTHRPTKPLVPARRLTPPACTPEARLGSLPITPAPLHRFSSLLFSLFLALRLSPFSFLLSPLFLSERRVYASSFSFARHTLEITQKKGRKKERRNLFLAFSRLSFFHCVSLSLSFSLFLFIYLSSFVSPFVRRAQAARAGRHERQPALRDYLLSDRTFLRACMRVHVAPQCVCLCDRGMKARARRHTCSFQFLSSARVWLPPRRHRRDHRACSCFSSLLSISSTSSRCVSLRCVSSPRSPVCIRESRRQRSAATARTTSFILSSLAAMPRAYRGNQ